MKRKDAIEILSTQRSELHGLFGLIRLQQHLEALLGCKVDVGTAAGLRPRIRERVLHEALRVA